MSKGFASNYRMVLLAVAVCACFGGLGVRLVELHVIDRDQYMPVIDRARRQIIVEKARRGDILDDRGNILATSRSMIVLGVDPQSVRDGDEKKWPELAQLTGLPLADLSRKFLTKTRTVAVAAGVKSPEAPFAIQLAKPADDEPANAEDDDDTELDDAEDGSSERPIRWAKLCDNISESTYDRIRALDIKGVYGNRVYRRAYPHNSLAAHIIGYVNKGGEAVDGIERYADFYLHGRDGWREGERDGRGREIAQFRTRDVPAADGYSVTLSIDLGVQHIIEEELAAIAQKYEPLKATIIVSDPRTGFILGLANYPTFDLNEYNKVPRDQLRAMRDIAITDQYEPGSCFKIVAASGGLNDGLITPSTIFDCSFDRIEYRGRVRGLAPEDHHFADPHHVPLTQVLSYSSNRGAAQIAMMLGDDRFYAYARAFGFGQLTGFPLTGEIDGAMAPPEKWDALTITRMPMGHSIAATPLQMHMAMGVIASGGLLLRPQIIREIHDSNGRVVYSYDTVEKRRVVTEQTARTMARMLMGVASNQGTAPTAAIPNYQVAGKTGTTQKIIDGRYSDRHHVASFIGFFPADLPPDRPRTPNPDQVAISVIVDDADARAPNGIAYGTSVAAPSFKHIGEQLIQYLDIKPVYSAAGPSIAMEGARR